MSLAHDVCNPQPARRLAQRVHEGAHLRGIAGAAIIMFVGTGGAVIPQIVRSWMGMGDKPSVLLVNALLLNPLPYENAGRLVLLSEINGQGTEMSVSVPNFLDWKAQSKLLEDFGGFLSESFNVTGGEQPERVEGAWLSASTLRAG